MARLRPNPIAALAVWTLFTWVSRIGLAWNDDGLSTGGKIVATIPVAIFVVLAVVVGAALLGHGRVREPALALAWWTIGYWVLRLPWILAHDHPGAFKVVHTVLAAVAVGLAVLVLRNLPVRPRLSPKGSRRAQA